MIRKFIWLIVLLVGVFGVAVHAIEVVTVSESYGFHWAKHNTRIGSDNRLIAWMDYEDDVTTIYACSISPVGEVLWKIECSSVQYNTYFMLNGVCTTSDGNAIIHWRNGSSMLAQAINPQGEMIWRNNLEIIPAGFGYNVMKIIPDRDGGIYVFREWNDLLYLRHITASGTDIITGGYIPILSNMTNGIGTTLVDNEGCIVITHSITVDYTVQKQVYRFDEHGAQMGNGPIITHNPFGTWSYDIISDKEGNLYCFSAQSRPLFGYLILRFDGSGLIPGENIGQLKGYPYGDNTTKLIAGEYSGCFYVVTVPTNVINYTGCTIYKYNNEYQSEWSVPISSYYFDNVKEFIIWEGSQQVLWVASRRVSPDLQNKLCLNAYNSNGSAIWANRIVVAESDVDDYYNYIAWGNNVAACMLWESNMSNYQLLKQCVSFAGEVIQSASSNIVASIPRGSCKNKALYVTEGKTVCIWEKGTTLYPGLYYQVFDVGLRALLEQNGRRLYPNNTATPKVMDTMVLPNGNVAILYSLSNEASTLCHLQIISPNGQILYPGYGTDIYYYGSDCSITNFKEDVLVTWHGYRTNHKAIIGQLVSRGEIIWSNYGEMLAWISLTQDIDKYIMQGNYLVWQESNSSNKLIFIKRIDENGNADPNWLLYQLDVAENMELMDAILIGDDVVVLMRSTFDYVDECYRWYAQKYDHMGLTPWGDAGVEIFRQPYMLQLDSIEHNDQRLIMKFSTSQQNNDNGIELLLVKLEQDGSIPFGLDGRCIGTLSSYNYFYSLNVDDNDVYSMWVGGFDNGFDMPRLHHLMFDPQSQIYNGSLQIVCDMSSINNSFCGAEELDYSYISWHDAGSAIGSSSLSIYLARAPKTGTSIIDAIEVPTAGMKLLGNYPNPFTTETDIGFKLGKDTRVSIQIYNIKGQLVRTLASASPYLKGESRIAWDGRDDKNIKCSAGVYMYRVESPEKSAVAKMLLLK